MDRTALRVGLRATFRMLVAGSDVGTMVLVRLEVAGPLGQDRSREFLERMGFRRAPTASSESFTRRLGHLAAS